MFSYLGKRVPRKAKWKTVFPREFFNARSAKLSSPYSHKPLLGLRQGKRLVKRKLEKLSFAFGWIAPFLPRPLPCSEVL